MVLRLLKTSFRAANACVSWSHTQWMAGAAWMGSTWRCRAPSMTMQIMSAFASGSRMVQVSFPSLVSA